MKKVLIVFAVIIALIIIWLFTLPGDYKIERSVLINAPQEKVFDKVADFKEWMPWSPWLIMEPDAQKTYEGIPKTVGSKYAWEGDLVGSGEMEITKLDGMNRVDYSLLFKTPYESEANVYFKLDAETDSTTMASWGMTGKMPFFMRFMTKMMVSYITMDYDRGLSMLKEYAETDQVLSKITYGTVVDVDEITFVGIRHQGTQAEIGNLMKNDFQALSDLFTANGYVLDGYPMAVYYNMDMTDGIIDFATAFPIQNAEDVTVAEPFMMDKIKAGKAFTVTHTGKYEHIGNGWNAAIMYARTKKLKANMKAPMWEVYTNSPLEVSPKDYETVIYLPLK